MLVDGIRHVEKRHCNIIYATLNIQRFTLMLLLVCMVDADEAIGFVLELGKLDTEFLVGLFEIYDFVV